jgi:chromosome segregation ATPase
MDRLEAELSQRDVLDQNADKQLRQEVAMLCQSLDDRDKKILELSRMYAALVAEHRDAEQQRQHLENVIETKNTEIFALEEKNASLDAVLNDRRTYARTVMELQGRMELVVEELRHSFTPAQFSSNISNLEQRVSNLFAVEAQLRQKDDLLAARDDEIQQLRDHQNSMERQISEVSSVFSKLPRSVAEVEELLVEVDEYRRRLQHDPEVQEMLQIRLLELQARRSVAQQAPVVAAASSAAVAAGGGGGDASSLTVFGDTGQEYSHSTVSVADKTGLLKTPR